MAPLIIAVVLAIFAIVLVASAVRIVRQSHVGMIERFGKYRATLSPGLHIVIPFFDRMRVVVDMRETVQPFAPQPVITEDNVTIAIDTVVYFQVTDAFRATYEVANFLTAMEQLAQTTLRNLVGAMTLEETLTSRDQINTQLREVLDEATEKWGVRVTRVELKSIDPPRSIQEAMEQQMRADRAKRATILQAEGEKQSAILRAEGARQAVILAAEADQQSLILRAEGDRQSRALRARGEAEALRARLRHGQEGGDPAVGHARLQVSGGAAGGRGRRREQAAAAPLGGFRRHGRRCRSGRRIRPGRCPGQGSGGAAAEAPPAPRGHASAGRGAAASRAPRVRIGGRYNRPRPLVESWRPPLGGLTRIRRIVIRTRRRLLGMLTAILAATLTSLLLAGSALADTATPEEPVSPNATAIDDIYLVILGATITIFVLVGGFLLYSSIRFRERPGDPDPPQTHGSTRLELGWTIVPILIVLGIAGYTLYKLPSVDDTPDDAMKVHVLAQQFTWSFEYPDGMKPKSTAANTLFVPEGKAVELEINSKDVIHDWWVPELGQKVDAIPGRTTTTWFKADAAGNL